MRGCSALRCGDANLFALCLLTFTMLLTVVWKQAHRSSQVSMRGALIFTLRRGISEKELHLTSEVFIFTQLFNVDR
jgi:hypothetical protein